MTPRTSTSNHGQLRPNLQLERLEDRLALSSTPLDLTTRGASGVINEAVFAQAENVRPGRGESRSFLHLQAPGRAGIEEGFNSTHRRHHSNHEGHQFSRALKLSQVPVVTGEDGTRYRVFVLDINQRGSRPLISLDELRLYTADVPNLRNLAGLSPIYDMDAGGDSWVKLDARLNRGNGRYDMAVYVPDRFFPQDSPNTFVYLYSKFGVNLAANGGAEIWATNRTVPPPPTPAPPPTPTSGSINGTIFDDANQNGLRETGEPGLEGLTVYLDMNQNGVLDAGDVSTTTNLSGQYSFTNLTIGSSSSYLVRVVSPGPEWFATTPEVVTVTLTLSQPDANDVLFGLSQEQAPT